MKKKYEGISPCDLRPPSAKTAGLLILFTLIIAKADTFLTKIFSITPKGAIKKDSHPQFASGSARRFTIKDITELPNAIDNLKPNECIATGIFDRELCELRTKDALKSEDIEAGVRARSKEHMSQPERGLILFDHDPSPRMPKSFRCSSPKELMSKLADAIPELKDIGFVGRGSSSSGIRIEKTGEEYSGGGGLHVYVVGASIDLDKLKRFLEVRLWNAGLGYIELARNGAMLIRTVVDLSVLSPERLIYEASPVLGEGLTRKPAEWTVQKGPDLSGKFELTDEEIHEYEHRVTEAKKAAKDASDELKTKHRKDKITELVEHKGVTREEAEKRVPQIDWDKADTQLPSDYLLDIGGKKLTVAELVEQGAEFDGTAMPDPIEGRDYGATTAKFYYNDGDNPVIHSFAHGIKNVYKLPTPDAFQVVPRQPHPLSETLPPEDFPHTSKTGSLKTTLENVRHMLTWYGITVRYDVIRKRTEYLIPGFRGTVDNYENNALTRIQSLATLNGLSLTQVPAFVASIADENAVNPIAEWIMGKSWDGTDRLQEMCDTLTVREGFSEELKKAVICKWLLSAVAAVLSPTGFHARGVLTLQGGQGLGKTSWIRNLVPIDILSDCVLLGHHLDPSNKDSQTTAISHWIVEIGELDSSFRKDIARLKGFLTGNKDKIRRPYARANSEYQRRTVFCATVNEENFLVDTTGNSRWWTLPVVKINYEHNIDMQQVFAQLAVMLKSGAEWWLTPEEEQLLESHNQDHRAVSALEDKLLSVVDNDLPEEKWTYKTATEVLDLLGYKYQSNALARECGTILRRLYGPPKKVRGRMKWKLPLPDEFHKI